ncbi:MAG: protocatechuate 3,4-dioxygenase subunit alpha [Rubrobacteraceae bacterium]
MSPEPTPSQTIGPFFHFALFGEDQSKLVASDHPSAIRLGGTVYDVAGDPVPDGMLEIWQADEAGRCAYPEGNSADPPADEGFSGFGRCATDEEGRFSFLTVKPGPVPGPDGQHQAPHILVSIFARGLLKRLVTRVSFPDEEDANAGDPVLNRIEDSDYRSTLIAREVDGRLSFDVFLQGDHQTVFFDV